MKNQVKPVYSGHVVEFTAVATEFCKYAEHASEIKGSELIVILQRLLPLLYLKGAMLPLLQPVFEDGNEKFVTEADWTRIHDSLKATLGRANDYIELNEDPASAEEGTIMSGIAEDLADIYQDMKNFILLYQTGTEEVMNDAVWECRMNFDSYWGLRLLSSLKALHMFIVSDASVEESDDETENEDDHDHHHDHGHDHDHDHKQGQENWFISKRQREFRDGTR